ncbi:MAG: TetR/AcrR family transcriptional regulator [Oscillospiraceae bacterium]|nr:TetR/AcrR family transcriptional regulator [Oscillospiraceae bacterium]
MNRPERKYFATAARMDQAFLELLEKKDFAYITVKEICEKAGVNRSTFYLHYETINDLLAESTRYIIDQFIAAMPHDTAAFMAKLQSRPLEELYLITPEYLAPYLNYIKEHRRIFRTTLEQASVLGMNDAYLRLNRHVFTPILDRFHIPPAEQKYMIPFYINGLMGIVNEWLEEDCKDSVEQIISVMRVCIAKHES